MAKNDGLLICTGALQAAEMRRGCTNHSYYAEILLKQITEIVRAEVNEEWEAEMQRQTKKRVRLREYYEAKIQALKEGRGVEVA